MIVGRARGRLGAYLLDAVRGSPPRAGSLGPAARRLPAAACHHRVVGAVRIAAAADEGLPSAVRAELDAHHRTSVLTHVRALADLAVLEQALGSVATPWTVLKGPACAALYSRPDLRSYTDLDVLVPARRFGAVLGAVEAAGGALVDRNWALLARETHGQVHLLLPHGSFLDLHWHLLEDAGTRAEMAIATDELLERARPVPGASYRSLDPADALLHLALHAALAGCDRLVWLTDIDRAARQADLSWDVVVARGRSWRAGAAIAVGLDRSRTVLGAPVPSGLAEALSGGRAWPAIDRLARRVTPVERSRGDRSLGRFVACSSRDSATRSAKAMLRRSAGLLGGGGRSPLALRPADPWTDGGPDRSLDVEHSSREAYLDRLSAADTG